MKLFPQNLIATLMLSALAVPAMAASTGSSSTSASTVVDGQGRVVQEKYTTVTRTPIKPGEATFYYYDPKTKTIVTGHDLTDDMISLWDKDRNRVIDNHEFYNNALIVYDTIQSESVAFKDVNGKVTMTQEQYTIRLQQTQAYKHLNRDDKTGLTLWEFTGVGFQDADQNNNNIVSYDELRQAFFAKEGLIEKPRKMNN